MPDQVCFKGRVVFQRYPKQAASWPGKKEEGVQAPQDEDTLTFRILSVHPSEPGESDISVKCNSFPDWDPEDEWEFYGHVEEDAKYGPTFMAEQALRIIPKSIHGIKKYLENHVDGVGKKIASALVDHFGPEIIGILDAAPLRVAECPGISQAKAFRIVSSWQKEHDPTLRQLEVWLAQHDIGSTWAKKFLAAFGKSAVTLLEENPYRSMKLKGIGFLKADEMASRMGWPECCTERTEAAVTYAVSESTGNGHCFMTENDLITEVRKVASSRKGTLDEDKQLPLDAAAAAINRVIERKQLIRESVKLNGVSQSFYYLPHLHAAEIRLAQRVGELQSFPHVEPRDIEETLGRVQADLGIMLSDKQREAIVATLKNNVSVLTGGPGSGKTTTLNALLQTATRLGLRVQLCAPTGRAAKRMSEVTGREALTIHKLLEWNPEEQDFMRNSKNTLFCSLLVVDESSMLDVQLADSLMDAVSDSCSVLFVGDIDQLPSVGAGMVLRDLIRCGDIHVTRLDRIFRQAEGALIVQNAAKIREGQMPIFPDVEKGKGIEADSYFMEVPKRGGKDDVDYIKEKLPAVIRRIVAKHGVDPIRDIQMLVPMKVGNAGVPKFNEVLQAAINGRAEEHIVKGQRFRIGDRVMQLSNNYNLGISNGDIGFILGWDDVKRILRVDFYGIEVNYPYGETDDLILAYAATIHKSQGSEFEIVIVAMTMHHRPMLERQLLYTANTRAKKMIVYLASWQAIKIAVETCDTHKRNTFLAQRIKRECRAAQVAKAA